MEVRYTDVDYLVFSDAAALVVSGVSPYKRSTYRYSPLIAYLVTPNSIIHRSWGKLLFSVSGPDTCEKGTTDLRTWKKMAKKPVASLSFGSHTFKGHLLQQGRPLPKFGEWDVNNPASADGFTVIFAKAKDDKGGGAANGGKQANNSKPQNDQPKKKWFCCF
ncbi:hypothetical protein AgCh_030707 [Apium graveolens]